VYRQSQLAITEADVVIFVFDGRAGISPLDREAVDVLRRAGKPTVYAVNKLDTAKQENLLLDFTRLGVEPLIPISAEHARGIEPLMNAVVARVHAPRDTEEDAPSGSRLALVGRPNVGKSSLLNRLAGHERSIVDAAPWTTRDPVDTRVRLGGRPYVLVDTAGIRRRSRVTEGVERLTVVRSLRALERAEIALVVLDATEGMTDQDARIAAYAWQRGRGVVLLVNKWDLVAAESASEERWLTMLRDRFPVFTTIPALAISAHTGWQIDRLPALIGSVERCFSITLPTRRLNQVLQAAVGAHAPPCVRHHTPRFFYATQVGTRPPQVAVFTSAPDGIHATYARYLQAQFTEAFGLRGTPLRLDFRQRRRT
jgi:GTP-binding protein